MSAAKSGIGIDHKRKIPGYRCAHPGYACSGAWRLSPLPSDIPLIVLCGFSGPALA
jgi:hypothetical protein